MNIHTRRLFLLAMRGLAFCAILSLFIPAVSVGQTLVGDVFVTGFDGWTDQYYQHGSAGGGLPTWGVLLTDGQTLMEASDGRAGIGGTQDGQYKPYIIVNEDYSTPQVYTLSARMGSWDDDGWGLVFGYVDNDNYCRFGFREQSSGSLGFPNGLSLQTINAGAITFDSANDWYATSGGWPAFDGTLMDVVLEVDGTSGVYAIQVDGTTYLSGTNANLVDRTAGHYGMLTWYEFQDSGASKQYGGIMESISVASDALNKTTTFADVIPTAWRALNMTNAMGYDMWGNDEDDAFQGEDYGNFRQDFRNGTIIDDSNGYDWATTEAPNIDFIGTAVVVDEPGNASWSDYAMTVRVTAGDNEGPGVLVRVQDDNTFYRVNFATQEIGSNEDRAPRGLSIQKCKGGVWSELYRDDQENPTFLYGDDVPFDLTVKVIGDEITVSLIDDPDGAATAYDWATVTDGSDPILTGSVGLTNWGGGDADNGIRFSAYGGQAGAPLLTVIPEPSTFVLSGLLSMVVFALWRRR